MVRSLFLLLLWRRLAFSRVILLLFFFLIERRGVETVSKGYALSIAFIETAQMTLDLQGLPGFCPDHNTCFKGFLRREGRMIMQIMHKFYDKSLARYRYQQTLYLQATFRTAVDSMMLYEDLFIRIEPTRLVELVHFTGLPRVVPFFPHKFLIVFI